MAEKKPTTDTAAQRKQARDSAARLHELAEKGLAELPPSAREARERAGSNSAWLHELAEKAQAELDRRKQREA